MAFAQVFSQCPFCLSTSQMVPTECYPPIKLPLHSTYSPSPMALIWERWDLFYTPNIFICINPPQRWHNEYWPLGLGGEVATTTAMTSQDFELLSGVQFDSPSSYLVQKHACKARRCDSDLQIWNYQWPSGGVQNTHKNKKIEIFKMQPKIVVMLPQSTQNCFCLATGS